MPKTLLLNDGMMIQGFLDYLRYERNRSPKTIKDYEADLVAFERYFQNLDSHLSWDKIDSDVIRDWMESMMDKGNNATSVNRRLSALRSFYRFALSRGLVEKDPAHHVEGPRCNRPLPQFLKESEMNRLIDDVEWGTLFKDVRARTIIIMFYQTGIRVSELVGLDDTSVDTDACEIKVTGKGNKQRVIPFGKELKDAVEAYVRQRDQEVQRDSAALFVNEKGQRLTAENVRREVRMRLQLVCTLKKKSPHVLRHTFATAMLNNGASIESVRKLLGHESASTTEIYTHTTFEQLKRVYEEAHPRA